MNKGKTAKKRTKPVRKITEATVIAQWGELQWKLEDLCYCANDAVMSFGGSIPKKIRKGDPVPSTILREADNFNKDLRDLLDKGENV